VELICLSRQGVPCLIGNTGVGKTDLVKDISKKHKKKLVIINTAVVNVDDLSGFPYREGDVMKWAIPDWFPREKDCVVFLDEFNRADKQVINALMPMLLSGELHHGAVLPEDCWVIVAFNPDTDDYDMVNSFDDLAISSRLFKLEVTNDPAAWNEWAQKNLNVENASYKTKLISNMKEFLTAHQTSVQINQIPNNRSFSKAIGVIECAKTNSDYYVFPVVEKALKGILGEAYVNTNSSLIRECLRNDKATLKNRLEDVLNNSTTSESEKMSSLDYILNDETISMEEYVEIRDNYLKFISEKNRKMILASMNTWNETTLEVFNNDVVESLWNM
jgi:hypothetical protein